MHEDTKDIVASIEAMTEAFHKGDLEGVMASYEPRASIVFEPGKSVRDRQAQEHAFREFMALSPHFTYTGHEVLVTGDLATHIAPWKMRATAPDGDTLEDHGLSIAVLRRQADGRWLMVMDNPHGEHLWSGAH